MKVQTRTSCLSAIGTDESTVTYNLKASNADDADHFTIDSITGEVTLRLIRTMRLNGYRFTVVEDEAG